MIGILTKNQAFVAQTKLPMLIEPISAFQHTKSLIPNHFLSISKKFHIQTVRESSEDIEFFVPVFPNEEVVSYELLNSGKQLSFVIDKVLKSKFSKGQHIATISDQIFALQRKEEKNCTWLICMLDHVFIFSKKEDALIYSQIFISDSVEELLFSVNKIYHEYQFDFEVDRIVLFGEADKKSSVYSLFHSYFRNISVEDFNPLILAS